MFSATMDTYGHLFPGQEADAVAQLRDMLVDHHSEPEALRATGTDSHAADSQQGAQRQAQRAGRETPLLPATGCEQPQCATKNADDPKSKESHALDTRVPHDATGCEERRRRDSNPGWRICNPT